MKDQRESLIFYRSFYEAIKELDLDKQGEIYNAIFDYGLNFNEPKLDGISKTVFTLVKPQLDANIKKYKNGKKAKDKQNTSKKKAKDKQNTSKAQGNVNDNVNKNDNEKVNVFKDFVEQNGNTNLTSILLKVLLELGYEPSKEETIESFREWFSGLGIPSDKCKKVIDNFYEYWIFEKNEGNIKKKKNWKLTFSNNPLLKDVTTS